ncbi:unnamed protein product [Soboliphyme baturini]|uniref:DHC_N1 domain-containing protein n=1 Tax=Soboliphyme baturini TaxID=241478 RepID=A0A183J6P4_9BILA|nr:unnamed protein product [Soboliphyme baturini]
MISRDHTSESGYLEPGCTKVLEDPQYFIVWIKLEEEQSSIYIESLLSESCQWERRFPQEENADDFKACFVPICTDNFLLMLLSMTKRFQVLPSFECRLRFARLQRLLVANYRLHLQQLSSSLQSVWLSPFSEVINSAEYMAYVLRRWQDQTLYIELEEGIFDEMIVLFTDLKMRMITDSVEAVLEECKENATRLVSAVNNGEPMLENVFFSSIVVPVQNALLQMQQGLR